MEALREILLFGTMDDVQIYGVYGLSVAWTYSKKLVIESLGPYHGFAVEFAVEDVIRWTADRRRDNSSRAEHAYCAAKYRVVGSLRWAGWHAWTLMTYAASFSVGLPVAVVLDLARVILPSGVASVIMAYSAASAGLATVVTAAAFGILSAWEGVKWLAFGFRRGRNWCKLLHMDTGLRMDRFSDAFHRVTASLRAEGAGFVTLRRSRFAAKISVPALGLEITLSTRASKVEMLVEQRRAKVEPVDRLIARLRNVNEKSE